MPPPDPDRAISPETSPRPAGGPRFGVLFRDHWLVRLGTRAMVLGISPFLISMAWAQVTGLQGANQAGLGILALVGANLGLLLLLAGAVVVGLQQLRARAASRH